VTGDLGTALDALGAALAAGAASAAAAWDVAVGALVVLAVAAAVAAVAEDEPPNAEDEFRCSPEAECSLRGCALAPMSGVECGLPNTGPGGMPVARRTTV
jgi:hypothetical protein